MIHHHQSYHSGYRFHWYYFPLQSPCLLHYYNFHFLNRIHRLKSVNSSRNNCSSCHPFSSNHTNFASIAFDNCSWFRCWCSFRNCLKKFDLVPGILKAYSSHDYESFFLSFPTSYRSNIVAILTNISALKFWQSGIVFVNNVYFKEEKQTKRLCGNGDVGSGFTAAQAP